MKSVFKKIITSIRYWHFFVIAILFAIVSVFALRSNNLKMIELREEVLSIDRETGDIKKVEPALRELANYVLNHMNTDMGTLELPGTFNTEVEKIQKRVERSGSANSAVYADAIARCEDPNILLTARAQCVQDYVTTNAPRGTNVQLLEFPDKTLYSYSFASPVWSPDLAGFSILIASISSLIVVVLFFSQAIMPAIGRFIDSDPLE